MTRVNKDNDFFSEVTKLAARDKALHAAMSLHDCSADRRGFLQLQDLTVR
jgi:hypothetical protein